MAKDPRAEFIARNQVNRQDDEGRTEYLEAEDFLEKRDGEQPRAFFIRQSHALREDAPTRKIRKREAPYKNTREDFINKSQRYAKGVLLPGQSLMAGGVVV